MVFAMTSAFSWQNSISLCPASFRTPRPNLPVTPGISWLPMLDHQKTKRVPEKHLLLLYWLHQSLWLCGSQSTVENSERDGNTRPPNLPLEKSVCRSGRAVVRRYHSSKRVWNAVLGCNLKTNRMISVRFQGKPFNITVIQVYAPTSNAEEAERFYEDLQDFSL